MSKPDARELALFCEGKSATIIEARLITAFAEERKDCADRAIAWIKNEGPAGAHIEHWPSLRAAIEKPE